ncbi:MAG: Holliday junction resolvase RuvX [Candidatus Nanopelagicales bacterium]
MPELERGVRLAIDVGSVRVGVARSDPDGLLAVPETTVQRDAQTIRAIGDLVREYEAVRVYVGLPLTLDGSVGLAGDAAQKFAAELAAQIDAPVYLVDERLSTVSAQRSLHDAGRTTRQSRSIVDQAAAVVILEGALTRERATGTPAGREVTVVDRSGKEGGS